VHYRLRDGRQKVVGYYAMRALDGSFAAGSDVDELRWLSPADAVGLLTYDHDRRVVDRFRHSRPSQSQLVLQRPFVGVVDLVVLLDPAL
jgi:8-oxo-dGTP diphosphatase